MLLPESRTILMALVPLISLGAGCSGASGGATTSARLDQAAVEPGRDAIVVQATPTSGPPSMADSQIQAMITTPPQPGGAGLEGQGSAPMDTSTGSYAVAPPPPPPLPTPAPPPSMEPTIEAPMVSVDDSEVGGAEMEEAGEAPPEMMAPTSDRRPGRRRTHEARVSRRESRRSGRSRPAPAAPVAPPPMSSPVVVTTESAPAAPSGGAFGEFDGDYWRDELGAYRQQQVQVQRMLTAATVADVDRRGNYLEYLSRHALEAAQLGLDMTRRTRFRVVDGNDRPLHDAAITVLCNGAQVVGRTHADGFWDFYPGVSAPQAANQAEVFIAYGGTTSQATVPLPGVGDGRDIFIRLPQAVSLSPSQLDLAFLIDVTGSMGDELAYVNEEVLGIVDRVRASVPQVNVRVAATFYRDRADPVPIEQIPFSADVRAFQAQMRYVQASGGGDYPEDVNLGLGAALTTLQWSTGPAVRVLVIIADAPPQSYPDFPFTYRTAMQEAARRGVRILPVAASGSDRVVEFLFRAMGAFTSTPYIYLTDDSGVGGSHMEADTDRVAVEMFSDVLTRLLISDLQGLGMHEAVQDQTVLVPLQ